MYAGDRSQAIDLWMRSIHASADWSVLFGGEQQVSRSPWRSGLGSDEAAGERSPGCTVTENSKHQYRAIVRLYYRRRSRSIQWSETPIAREVERRSDSTVNIKLVHFCRWRADLIRAKQTDTRAPCRVGLGRVGSGRDDSSPVFDIRLDLFRIYNTLDDPAYIVGIYDVKVLYCNVLYCLCQTLAVYKSTDSVRFK